MTPAGLIDFEREWPRHSTRKESAIRDWGLTPARYYLLLQRAAASLEGQAHDPFTAHRVSRRARPHFAHTLPTSARRHAP